MHTVRLNRGFTLIELLVAMAVLAVIAAGVIVAINPAKRIAQANDTKTKNDIGQLATALQAYFTTNQFYPTATSVLVTSGDLKQVPLSPTGVAYNYSRTAGCASAPYTGCEAQANFALQDPLVAGNLWCWRSATGQALEGANCAP